MGKENISFLILTTLFSIFRADTFYRLCYASILIHWRSYMMYTRESLFQSLFSFDMVTIWQAIAHWAAVSCPGVRGHGAHPQHAHCWQQDLWGSFCPCQVRKATNFSFIYIQFQEKQSVHSAKPMFDPSRYWFVKSSLQTEVMETFKRDQFVYKVLLLPQVIVR